MLLPLCAGFLGVKVNCGLLSKKWHLVEMQGIRLMWDLQESIFAEE